MGVAYYENPSIAANGEIALVRVSAYKETSIGEISINAAGKTPAIRLEAMLPGNQPRVSPDGRMIAYISNGEELMTFDRSTGSTRCQQTLATFTTNPAWSSDGRTLAFVSLRDGNADIWMTIKDENSPRRMTNDPANDFQPCWHADGVHLVWISDRNGIESLYCMNTVSGKINRLTEEPVENPAISPDGKHIAFVAQSRIGRSLRLHHLTEQLELGPLIWKLDGRVKVWAGYRPRFSPNGRWLGYEAPVEPAGGDIFAVPVNDPVGSPPVRLTAFPSPISTAFWWDWIDNDRLVVSYYPIQARLLLLRDADHWFERALVGKPAEP
jgi:Tol biopolymer transport system component